MSCNLSRGVVVFFCLAIFACSSSEDSSDRDTESNAAGGSDTDFDSAADTDSNAENDTETLPPDEVASPVKVLIAMDQSSSLQCTDSTNNRISALNRAADELDLRQEVQFSTIGFASWSRSAAFADDWDQVSDILLAEDNSTGSASDYQGALATALRVLEQDMLAAEEENRASTNYIVLFLTDGIPTPRCNEGCDDGDAPPDSLYGICNTTEDIPDDIYVDMYSQCPEYNQTPQILEKVQDIVSLAEFYGVGRLSFNAISMLSPYEVIETLCGNFADDLETEQQEAVPLLQAMADEGNGTYRSMDMSGDIDFLEIDFEPLGGI